MKREIINLIAINNYQHFIFKKCKSDDFAVTNLKQFSRNVPDEDGVYFVFAPLIKNRNIEAHLIYEINNCFCEFIYFGKAGGVTSEGIEGTQKLNGRINNVVGSNYISRAIKWNQEMRKYNIDSFIIYYCLLKQPQTFESRIYEYLKNENLKYPLLNIKRGRPAKK